MGHSTSVWGDTVSRGSALRIMPTSVPGAHSLFTTETASFQVDVSIPGVVTPVGFGPAPPPAVNDVKTA
jgi:hypothetical protein